MSINKMSDSINLIELLQKIDDLEQKGVKLPKTFNIEEPIENLTFQHSLLQMALNQSYELYDLLYHRFGGKKDYYRISRIEKEYLKNLSIKRDDKSLRRVVEIKLRIVNDLNKNNFNKKYQIQLFCEYNMIRVV